MKCSQTTDYKIKTAISASLLASVVLASSAALAQSSCKLLDEKACADNATCSWVKGYERKDGRTVKPFCRSKGKRSTGSTGSTGSIEGANESEKPASDDERKPGQ